VGGERQRRALLFPSPPTSVWKKATWKSGDATLFHVARVSPTRTVVTLPVSRRHVCSPLDIKHKLRFKFFSHHHMVAEA